MSRFFGKVLGIKSPEVPAAPPPPDPAIAAKAAADAQRKTAYEQETAGRKSTIVAGATMAADDQMERGMLKRKQRMDAAADVLGG
jgi:hypothetical protein